MINLLIGFRWDFSDTISDITVGFHGVPSDFLPAFGSHLLHPGHLWKNRTCKVFHLQRHSTMFRMATGPIVCLPESSGLPPDSACCAPRCRLKVFPESSLADNLSAMHTFRLGTTSFPWEPGLPRLAHYLGLCRFQRMLISPIWMAD